MKLFLSRTYAMIYQRQKQTFLYSFTAITFKTGKDNITTIAPGLFACKVISFPSPFSGGQQVTVLASVGHTVKSQTPRNGAAVWIETVKASEFTACVLEFGTGSNRTVEVNWLSFQAPLRGSQSGTTSLNSWTTGTECKKIDFQQVIIALSVCFQLVFSLPRDRFFAPSLHNSFVPSFPSFPHSPRSVVPSFRRSVVPSFRRSVVPSFRRSLVGVRSLAPSLSRFNFLALSRFLFFVIFPLASCLVSVFLRFDTISPFSNSLP